MSKTDRWALAALLAVVAAAFARTLGFEFVYDDVAQIVTNDTLGQPGVLRRAFAHSVWSFAPDLAEPRYYRPTFVLWLHGMHALVGTSPGAWHAGTLGLHLLATGVLFAFVRRYTGSWLVALLGTGLFALHPTRAESVAWVSGLTDPMAAALGFGAGLALLAARPDLAAEERPARRTHALALLLFVLALLSKETALVFVALPAGLALFGSRAPGPLRTRLGDAARLTAPWLLATLAVLLVRRAVLGHVATPYADLSLAQSFRTGVVLVGTYAEHLLLPGRLSLTTPVAVVEQWADARLLEALPGLLVATPILVAGALLGGRSRLLIWLGIGFLLPVLRVESLQPDMLFQDRYLYLPSACWLPVVVWGMVRAQEAGEQPGYVVPSVVGLVACFLVGVLQVNLGPWADNQALWQRAVEVHPHSGRAWFNLGTELENSEDLQGAEAAYMRAATEEPERAIFHFRLGYMLAERRALPEARTAFSRAASLRPQDPMMLYEAGRIERFVGSAEQARRLLDAAAAAADAGATIGGGITREDIERERRALRPHPPGGP